MKRGKELKSEFLVGLLVEAKRNDILQTYWAQGPRGLSRAILAALSLPADGGYQAVVDRVRVVDGELVAVSSAEPISGLEVMRLIAIGHEHVGKTRVRRRKERKVARVHRPQLPKKIEPRPNNYRATRDAFLTSDEWRRLRYAALKKAGAVCQACNSDRNSGKVMHVDHIRPMWSHWHLRAEPENLQVLCADCNIGKGAWDETDWR